MKLRFSDSWCLIAEKISVRDQVIGRKCIYSDTNTLHRQSVGHCRGWVWSLEIRWLVFIGCVISYPRWEPYSNCFGERLEISRNWATAHLLVLMVPWNCPGTSGCVIQLADWGSRSGQRLTFLPSWTHLILIGLCCVLGLCHCFKVCPGTFPPVSLAS